MRRGTRKIALLAAFVLLSRPPAPRAAESPGLELFATIAQPDLIPEGIAFDPATRALFVGSIHQRKIVALAADGTTRDFARARQDGLWSVLGMKVDPDRRTLLACSGVDGPGMSGYSPADLGKSALFEFDLATGKTLHVFRAPAAGRHFFNDVALARGGAAYVTDSAEGSVYRIVRGSGIVERFAPAGRLVYPNGIALDPSGRTLFVADARTIYAVDLATKTRRELGHSPRLRLGEADGLYFDRGALIAIQNGKPPVRVARFSLSPSLDRVTGEMRLAEGDPRLPEPTTAAIDGDVMYLVGDAQLRAIGKDGALWPRTRLAPVRVYAMALRIAPADHPDSGRTR